MIHNWLEVFFSLTCNNYEVSAPELPAQCRKGRINLFPLPPWALLVFPSLGEDCPLRGGGGGVGRGGGEGEKKKEKKGSGGVGGWGWGCFVGGGGVVFICHYF